MESQQSRERERERLGLALFDVRVGVTKGLI